MNDKHLENLRSIVTKIGKAHGRALAQARRDGAEAMRNMARAEAWLAVQGSTTDANRAEAAVTAIPLPEVPEDDSPTGTGPKLHGGTIEDWYGLAVDLGVGTSEVTDLLLEGRELVDEGKALLDLSGVGTR